ncbi:glycoside hydrolase family 1 protein [Nakamurella deserti]|uniref:glycoside hydrolase family 1 protein n=1 Tax=Nakamurella deserti TaxID=2164074 RepID=UPI00197B6251|nr:family 1 glycosylhydrolase [Nakamurella deserti]
MVSHVPLRRRLDARPGGFRFGVSTAATCVESREPAADGVSIWDVFAAAPGRVTDGSGPREGPDHFTHWSSDVGLLADLGVDSYRLSLSWSALGEDAPGRPAMSFYQRLVDALVAAGIRPVVTLTHYDMPLTAMEAGGWLVSDTAEIFADHATDAVAALGDRVDAWVTMNAPFIHTALGYGVGIEAPGLTLLGGALIGAQHQLVGHGRAVQALRAGGARLVGIANAHTDVRPAGPEETDITAAALYDALHNHVFTDPLLGLGWPERLAGLGGAEEFDPTDADRAAIAAPLDFYGVNYYHPQWIAAEPENRTIPFAITEPPPDVPVDAFGWPADPAALTGTLLTLTRDHPELPPLWVTENGTQDTGGDDDGHRARYLVSHLSAVADAVDAGADVGGYFHWSLLDGWEFAEGLGRRFGLVSVDPVTRARTPKRSFGVYRDLLAGHRTA